MVLHAPIPFIPPRFVACESNRTDRKVASGGNETSTSAGVCSPANLKRTELSAQWNDCWFKDTQTC
eukprot:6193824-Pleurochrysis_carterae.AAC.1